MNLPSEDSPSLHFRVWAARVPVTGLQSLSLLKDSLGKACKGRAVGEEGRAGASQAGGNAARPCIEPGVQTASVWTVQWGGPL